MREVTLIKRVRLGRILYIHVYNLRQGCDPPWMTTVPAASLPASRRMWNDFIIRNVNRIDRKKKTHWYWEALGISAYKTRDIEWVGFYSSRCIKKKQPKRAKYNPKWAACMPERGNVRVSLDSAAAGVYKGMYRKPYLRNRYWKPHADEEKI